MRRQLFIAGGVASLLAAGGVSVATLRSGTPAPASLLTVSDNAASGGSAAAPAPAARRPHYLPAGVTPASEVAVGREGAYQIVYRLPGAANANTIPARGLSRSNYATVHAATELVFAAVPWTEAGFPPLLFDAELAGTDVVTTTIAGNPARLSMPRSGLGVQRVEWIADGRMYTLLCDRVSVKEGIAGLDRATLLRIAESVR